MIEHLDRGRRTSLLSHEQKSVLPQEVEHQPQKTLQQKQVKIGARVMRHGSYITFQLAEVAIVKALFAQILRLIDRL